MPALLRVVSFERLGLTFDLHREAFSIGGLTVYWYGIIIAVGFLLAVWYCFNSAKNYGIDPDDITNMLIWTVPIAIIGARAYYVFFRYNDYYYGNPKLMFRIWDGGLAIYGAVIASVITVAVYCKVKHIRLGSMLDMCCLGLLIGQAIGRWGNFVNVEAYGNTCNYHLLAMKIEDLKAYFHPCFLYESLWCTAGFVILHFYQKHRKYCGEVFLLYVAWYGFGRGFIEGLRQDSLYIFQTGLRISQCVAFVSCAVSLAIIVYLYLFRERNEEELASPYYTPKAKNEELDDEFDDDLEDVDEFDDDIDDFDDEIEDPDGFYKPGELDPTPEETEPMGNDESDESDEEFYGKQ